MHVYIVLFCGMKWPAIVVKGGTPISWWSRRKEQSAVIRMRLGKNIKKNDTMAMKVSRLGELSVEAKTQQR
jgi:hypothetical protein